MAQCESKIENLGFFMLNRSHRFFPFLVCTLAALFLFYEFILQIAPSVITDQLMLDFHLNAFKLGIITGSFFFAYTPMQLLAGLSFDRFGARTTLTFATLACAIGALLLSTTHSPFIAGTGRFLTGAGAACAFVGMLFLGERWFAARHFFLVAGITELMGCLGAVSGEAPTAAIVNAIGWRPTVLYLGIFGVILAFFIFLIVREKPLQYKKHEEVKTLQALKMILSNTQSWIVGLYAFTIFAPISAFAALWGVPYLTTRYHITPTHAGLATSMIWIGMGLGSPLAGWLSEMLRNRRLLLGACGILGLIITSTILYVPSISLPAMFVLLFFYGVASSGQSLSFNVVNDNTKSNVIGTALGFNNLMVVISGAIFQPLVGMLLKLSWKGKIENGVPIYSLHAYENALIILPTCYAIGFLICLFFLKESHPEFKSR
jgi:MFS family permease